jgi:gas vesicle protein
MVLVGQLIKYLKGKEEKKMSKKSFIAGLAIGVGAGILFAPKSGKETREDLKKCMTDLINKAKDVDIKEVKENIEKKINEIKEEIKTMDKEKALNIAKAQAKKIAELSNSLVEYVKAKGTPVMEKTAEAVREKSISVTKDILDKLEKKDEEEAEA